MVKTSSQISRVQEAGDPHAAAGHGRGDPGNVSIPFTIANLVNEMQAGCGMDVIVRYGVQLIVTGCLLVSGVAAGNTCAIPPWLVCNWWQDMFYRIQD